MGNDRSRDPSWVCLLILIRKSLEPELWSGFLITKTDTLTLWTTLKVSNIHRGQSDPRERTVINRRRRSKHNNNTDNWNLQGSNNWPLDDTQRFIIVAAVLLLIIVTKGVAVHISPDQTGFSNTTKGALVSRYSFIFAVSSSGEECFHVIDLLMLYLPGTWAQMSVPLWNPLLLLTSGTCNGTERLLKLQLYHLKEGKQDSVPGTEQLETFQFRSFNDEFEGRGRGFKHGSYAPPSPIVLWSKSLQEEGSSPWGRNWLIKLCQFYQRKNKSPVFVSSDVWVLAFED